MKQINKTLIQNCYILTSDENNTFYENGALLIEDEDIVDIGTTEELEKYIEEADEVIDAEGKVVIPGLINTHLHSGLIRGTAEDMPLWEWITKHVDPMHKVLKEDEAYLAAKLCYIESIRSGTTCVMDMYRYMHKCADAAEETGIRAVLVPYVADKPQYDYFENLDDNETLIRERNNSAEGRVKVWVGLEHLVYCSENAFKRALKMAEKYETGIHTHGEESFEMAQKITKKYGKRPIKVFHDYGILGPNTVLAHCVWLTPEEIEILRTTNTGVAHCPTSNMKLASGVASIPELIDRGVKVGLATDGVKENNNLDMLEEMKIASLLQKVHHLDATKMDATKVFRMATIEGARTLNLEDEIGSLEIGKKADIVIVDLNKTHTTPVFDGKYSNVLAHLVFAANGADVDTVFINGKEVLKAGELLTDNESLVISKATEAAKRMVERREEYVPEDTSIDNVEI